MIDVQQVKKKTFANSAGSHGLKQEFWMDLYSGQASLLFLFFWSGNIILQLFIMKA